MTELDRWRRDHLPAESPDLCDPALMDDAVALAQALVESQLARPVSR